jgi:hypothetical protein
MIPTDPTDALFAAAQGPLDTALPKIIVGVGLIAVVAFSIKGLWVAWRAGSKAVGKVGA